MKVVIFTDLDGSLLNHEGYSYAEAASALDRIKGAGIPLIMTTSKTRREVEPLQREMGMNEPVIVENGGGIFIPRGYRGLVLENQELKEGYTVIRLGASYSRIRGFLERTGVRFGIRGFGDMDPEEIARLTGLPVEKAALAKEREFTEPFIREGGGEIGPLSDLAAKEGLKLTRGGRFHHLMGRGQDKGKAVRMVYDIFRRNAETKLTAIGLGDSENDLAMFAEVDIPVLIPRPEKGYLDIEMPGLVRARDPGAKGWNDAVHRLLNEYG